ncbi:MAG: type II 3-dehydroquinate dehydratase [Bacteroidia bacterium]
MLRIGILHGPNLSQIGKREPLYYGARSWEDFWRELCQRYEGKVELFYFQSNHEGTLIDWLEKAEAYDGIILNPGALSHSSYALYDALRNVSVPCIEVHLSNIYQRERFRHRLLTARACQGVIAGLGLEGYRLAIEFFTQKSQSIRIHKEK